MGQRDDLLARIRDAKAIIEGQRASALCAKTPEDRFAAEIEIKRQEQYIKGMRFEWMSVNPGKRCPV